MGKSFSAAVDAFVRKCEVRMDAVVKTAAQAVLDDANLEGPSMASPGGGKGGRMPVDTGFLRNSLVAGIGSMPSGPSDPRTDDHGDPAAIELVIANMQAGQKLYAGWSAQHARPMEARYAFRDAAAQKWQQHVKKAVDEVKRRIP